ncbi:MAG: prepilin peptidase [Spirochaetia bacterium]|nr:prepilin peptidase [Spirochaetia bacterium]
MNYQNFIFPVFYGFLFSSIASFARVFTQRARMAFYESSRKKINDKWKFILSGRSRCDHCQEIIAPVYLIPILGYIIARGKCSRCSSKISKNYIIEEVLAFMYGFIFYNLNSAAMPRLVIMPLYFFICYYISKIDFYYFLIPGESLLSFAALSVFEYIYIFHYPDLILSLSIPLTWFALLHLVNYLMPGKLGLADIHLILILTFASGYPHSIHLPSLASFVAIPYFFIKNKNMPWKDARKTKIPFGLYLSLAFLLLKLIPMSDIF